MWTFAVGLMLVASIAPLATAAFDDCGGTYRGFQYTISSPNYPKEYNNGVDCVYRLEAADESLGCEQVFHLQFLDFQVKASESCRDDYLLVGERNVFCGEVKGLRKFTGRNNSLTLRFHAGRKDTAKGFKILVSALPCSLKLDPLRYRSEKGSADVVRPNDYKRGIRDGEVNDSTTVPPRITSYLFVPPKEDNSAELAIPPADNFLPPSRNSLVAFSRLKEEGIAKDKSSLGLPARNYGEPGIGVVDYDLQVNGVDCEKVSSERINYDPGAQGSSRLVYDPRYGFVGSNGYNGYNPSVGYSQTVGYPVNSYNPSYSQYSTAGYNSGYNPGYNSGYNLGYNPDYNTAYNPGYNSGFNPSYNPEYNSGFNPSYNPGYNTGYNPSIGGNNWNGAWNIGIVGQAGDCCQVQSSRRFAIVSPGFPNSASSAHSCRYTIAKSSPDVCRLRLNFRYFNFGSEDPYCNSGNYVEIEGRRYCGCKTGQSFHIQFTDLVKTINVIQSAYSYSSRSKFNGFLIDVVQESCSSSYPYDFANPIDPGFGYLRRRLQRNATTDDDQREKRDLGYSYTRPSVPFQHERTFGGNNCQSRVFFDWAIASKEAILRNIRCSGLGNPTRIARTSDEFSVDNGDADTTCEDINAGDGVVKSPLYPSNYPDNSEICYRFNKAPNSCKLELHLQDFDLEDSKGCEKDHLSFSGDGRKYCGRSLNGQTTVFDITLRNSVEVYFTADSYGTGRGFNIGFTQLPCDDVARNV